MERRTSSRAGTNGRERGDAGFTLLELLVTIVVLGILSSTVVLALQSVRSSAASAACQSDFATTAVALNAYRAEMGGYPNGLGGSGTDVVTDSDPGTAPSWIPGQVPSGVNAARSGGELLVAGTTSPNTGSADVGPWIKQAPANAGNYSIWVANDGSGAMQVLTSGGDVPSQPTGTANDCSSATAQAGSTTTSDVTTTVPATTSTFAPPTTTTVPPRSTTTTTTTITTTTTTTTTTPARVAPAFTSQAGVTFSYRVYGSFTATASGTPGASIKVAGRLPSGLTFDRSTDVFSGTPKTTGVFRLTLTASNGVNPNAVQSFTLTVR